MPTKAVTARHWQGGSPHELPSQGSCRASGHGHLRGGALGTPPHILNCWNRRGGAQGTPPQVVFHQVSTSSVSFVRRCTAQRSPLILVGKPLLSSRSDASSNRRLGLVLRLVVAFGWRRCRRCLCTPAVVASRPHVEPADSQVMARPSILPSRLPVEHGRHR